MKIKIGEERELILEEIYNGALLRTRCGNAIGVCMRDDTLEINIIPKGSKERNWWRVNMQEGTIERSGPKYTGREALIYLLSFIKTRFPALQEYIGGESIDPCILRDCLPSVLILAKEIALGKYTRFNESMIIVQALLDSQNPEPEVKELNKNILSYLMDLVGDKIPSVDRIVLQNYIYGKFSDPRICRSSLLTLVGFGLHELSSVTALEYVKHVQSFLDSKNPENKLPQSSGT